MPKNAQKEPKLSQFFDYQMSYALSQMTDGLLDINRAKRAYDGVKQGDASKAVPFVISQQRETVDRYREALESIKARRTNWQLNTPTKAFPEERDYRRLQQVEADLSKLTKALHSNPPPSPEWKRKLVEHHIRLAKIGLGEQ